MGCSCDKDFQKLGVNILQTKENCRNEYYCYLDFIHKLKGYLNSSQISEKNYGEEINENITNVQKEFYLIPSILLLWVLFHSRTLSRPLHQHPQFLSILSLL